MPAPITDPNLLAQLEGTQPKPVTDPALLAALEGGQATDPYAVKLEGPKLSNLKEFGLKGLSQLRSVGRGLTFGVSDLGREEDVQRLGAAAGPWEGLGGLVTGSALGSAVAPLSRLAQNSGLLARMGASFADATGLNAGIAALRAKIKGEDPAEAAKQAAANWGMNALAPGLTALGAMASHAGPASNTAAAKLRQVDPVEAEVAYGQRPAVPGAQPEPREVPFQRAGARAKELGMVEPGVSPGEAEVIASGANQGAARHLGVTIKGLERKGATVATQQIENDLAAIRDKYFQPIGPGAPATAAASKGVAMMNDLIDRFKANPNLAWGSKFGNFVTLKRQYQAGFEPDVAPGSKFEEAVTNAQNEAAAAIRKGTEEAAMRADPQVLGPRFKSLNQAIHENMVLETGARDASIGSLGQPVNRPRGYSGKSAVAHTILDTISSKAVPHLIKYGDIIDAMYQGSHGLPPAAVTAAYAEQIRRRNDAP